MWPFLNPTTEVVTFRLRGWCMRIFTHVGHECQDLLSPCNGMHVCTDYTSVYTLIQKSFGGMESEPMLTPREKLPSTGSSEEDCTLLSTSSSRSKPNWVPV